MVQLISDIRKGIRFLWQFCMLILLGELRQVLNLQPSQRCDASLSPYSTTTAVPDIDTSSMEPLGPTVS